MFVVLRGWPAPTSPAIYWKNGRAAMAMTWDLRYAAKLEQLLRLRSRPLTFCHHCRSPGREACQRLSLRRPGFRRYVSAMAPNICIRAFSAHSYQRDIPRNPTHINATSLETMITKLRRRYQVQGREQGPVHRIPPGARADTRGARYSAEGGHVP
jgi:hypothetical protein